jgi:hypothetical protein
MHLKELIKQIEHDELSPAASDGTLKFYCASSDRRLPEPRHASEYKNSGLLNYPYQKTPSNQNKTHAVTDAAETALYTGWIIPLPIDIVVHKPGSTPPVPLVGKCFENTGFVKNYVEDRSLHTSDTIFSVRTRWFIDVPDGYSVFYTSPANFTDSRFSIIPGVVDADEFPMEIDVPIIPLESDFTMDSGTPLLHVYPFKRTDYDISARTGILTDTDE